MVATDFTIYSLARPANARGPRPRLAIDRFMEKVIPEPNSGCWLWSAAWNAQGYGVLGIGSKYDGTRRNVLAHRLSLYFFATPAPDECDIDHRCRVPCCVNPDHLEVVTHRENIFRGKNSALRSQGKWNNQ